MRGVFVGAVALLALAGCKSTADRNAEADGYCQSIGARPGSDAYMQCRLVQQQRQDARRAAGLRMMNEGLSDVQRSVTGGRTVNCTSRRGNFDTVDTTCY